MIFLQIIIGGFVASTGASLACPDFPLCFGRLLPKTGPQHLQMTHRAVGFFIAATVLALVILILRDDHRHREQKRALLISLGGLSLLVLLQGVLGWVLIYNFVPPYLAVVHLCLAQAAAFWSLSLYRSSRSFNVVVLAEEAAADTG